MYSSQYVTYQGYIDTGYVARFMKLELLLVSIVPQQYKRRPPSALFWSEIFEVQTITSASPFHRMISRRLVNSIEEQTGLQWRTKELILRTRDLVLLICPSRHILFTYIHAVANLAVCSVHIAPFAQRNAHQGKICYSTWPNITIPLPKMRVRIVVHVALFNCPQSGTSYNISWPAPFAFNKTWHALHAIRYLTVDMIY